ncbi:MAG: hypothetical protein AB8B49_09040, partial [Nitratireductor sp.]
MANANAPIVRAELSDSGTQKTRNTSGLAGYARQLSHPAYERLLNSENFLRKLVPVLIVIFLVVIAAARWIQINDMGKQIMGSAKTELNFVAELIEEKISNADLKNPVELTAAQLQSIIGSKIPDHYTENGRQFLLSDAQGIVIATVPTLKSIQGK